MKKGKRLNLVRTVATPPCTGWVVHKGWGVKEVDGSLFGQRGEHASSNVVKSRSGIEYLQHRLSLANVQGDWCLGRSRTMIHLWCAYDLCPTGSHRLAWHAKHQYSHECVTCISGHAVHASTLYSPKRFRSLAQPQLILKQDTCCAGAAVIGAGPWYPNRC